MKTTLERPATKAPAKPITDFSERCDSGVRAWLGITRLTRVPDSGFPSRKSCQDHVTAQEAADGIAFIEHFRSVEAIERANNIPLCTATVQGLEKAGGFEQSMEAQRLREELRNMDEKKFISAIEELRKLRADAVFMCEPILERILNAFDEELNETALAREAQLQAMGVGLFSDGLDTKGVQCRTYELHSDTICNALHVRREIIRHALINLSVENAVGCVQYLTSGEEVVPFQWLA